jgi:hypothetical protein
MARGILLAMTKRTTSGTNRTLRMSDLDWDNIGELADHMKVSRTTAIRHAIFELRGKYGLHVTDGLRTIARLEREYGDRGLIVVTMGDLPRITVTVNGNEHPELRAHAFVALVRVEDGPVQVPHEAQVLLVDKDTGARFDLPAMSPVEPGATVTVLVRDLYDRLRPPPDPERSAEQRRWEDTLHKSLRTAAGIPDEDDE